MSIAPTSTTKDAASPDDLSAQIASLREDLKALASTIEEDLSERVEKAGQQIGQAGRDARATAATAVTDHPLTAVGIAAGIGLLLGLLARRG